MKSFDLSRCKNYAGKVPAKSPLFCEPQIAPVLRPKGPISHDASVLSLRHYIDFVYRPLRPTLTKGSLLGFHSLENTLSEFLGRPAVLADLNQQTVRDFLADQASRWAVNTVQTKRAELLSLWRVANDEDLLPTLPNARKIPSMKIPSPIPQAWTLAEVAKILKATRDPPMGRYHRVRRYVAGLPAADWWESFFLAAYDTGERRGALLCTRSVDVDLPGQSIVFRYTKTRKPRFCPLRDETCAAIARIYDAGRERMWPWPWSRATFDTRVAGLFRQAGVSFGRANGGVMHKMRKTSGSLVEAAGGDGSRQIGNTRKLFVRHYLDPRCGGSQLRFLPPPIE